MGVGRWRRRWLVQVAAASAGLSSKEKEALAALPASATANLMATCPQRFWWVCSGYQSIILLLHFGFVSLLLSNEDFLLLHPLLLHHQF